ncbi:MAG: DRTGG domain-containing protein [Clostridia bacterium]|nr:DRTGG domain-containing protein [Clostridia bacterium]
MKLSQIVTVIDGKVLSGNEYLDKEVTMACGSDMMSDVLAFAMDRGALLTGLVNPQVIRTALMMDMCCIIFVRGKMPTKEMIELAKDSRIAMLVTDEGMFETCGKLYAAGLGKKS